MFRMSANNMHSQAEGVLYWKAAPEEQQLLIWCVHLVAWLTQMLSRFLTRIFKWHAADTDTHTRVKFAYISAESIKFISE